MPTALKPARYAILLWGPKYINYRLGTNMTQSGLISGIASSFSATPDRQGDRIQPGAFAKTLARHAATGTMPGMHWSHMQESVVGRWIELREGRAGLEAKGQINLRTDAGRNAFESVSAGDVRGLSIGFATVEDGRKYLGAGVFLITEIDLVEISLVATPADPAARVTSVKALIESKAELVDRLHEAGLAKAAAQRIANGGWPALAGADDDTEHQSRLEALVRQATAAIKKGL